MGAVAIELRTGVAIEYAEQGDRSGTPLLLLPGLGDSWQSFKPVLDYLPDSIRAFALTLRGHGDSTHPPEGYGFRDFAADIEGFMDALTLPAAVIAAHSASGFFAQRLAIDHPRKVLGLVFVASPLTLRSHPGLRQAWDSTISKLADPVDPDFVRETQAGTLAKPLPQDFFETLVAEAMKVPARVWRDVFSHLLDDDLIQEVGKIQSPTLVVWGDGDEGPIASRSGCARSRHQRIATGRVRRRRALAALGRTQALCLRSHGLHPVARGTSKFRNLRAPTS
ncbi:MAG: alpha/beta fold hydrolase [Pseudonocardiaceae bacterium]